MASQRKEARRLPSECLSVGRSVCPIDEKTFFTFLLLSLFAYF